MFTGIIETLGRVASVRSVAGGLTLEVKPAKRLAKVWLGESIAVNGVCLTVSRVKPGKVVFDVIRQTLRIANLAALKAGDEVNLERALKYGDRLSGHYVLGHVETTAKILKILKNPKETEVQIELPKDIARRVVLRGCIAVDGISLTVSRRSPKAFSVHVIPHTWAETNLKNRKPGERVNLEADVLLKMGRNFVQASPGKTKTKTKTHPGKTKTGPGQKRIGIPR